VGSSGKGATPIPITIEEYNNIDNVDSAERAVINEAVEQAEENKSSTSPIVEEVKVVHVTNAKVGNNVEIVDGPFNGMIGEVKRLDNTNGIAVISVDMFGRSQDVDVKYEQFKLAV
jgi:transcriptional antiterminator NusG